MTPDAAAFDVSRAPDPGVASDAKAVALSFSEVEEAMARLADGDRAALRVVHDAVRPPMLRAAERLLGRGADAEDATQNALQKLFSQAADYDRARRVVPWAVALVLFESRTLRRQHQRRKADPVDTERFQSLAATDTTASDMLENAELLRLAEDLMGTLSDADRETLSEVLAEREDGRGSAFRKRKQRAIERLRDAWRVMHGS